VRPAADFNGELGHIAGARCVPLEELEARLAEFGADRTRTVALVCRTERRSAQAAQLLARHGYAEVHVVRGGMTAWNQAGWPVERV
jgi:rhodanese-related sulfurtransferase